MKKFKYDVSIIIPVYNTELYIEECVESIESQKYDANKIEIILINDGSADKSLDVCKQMKQKYNNIVLIDKKNEGVSKARNEGIKASHGKYIMLLDSDDMISPNTIKNLVEFFDKNYNEIDLVTYPIYWYREGEVQEHLRYSSYDRGTGIYDLEEYPYLNQSTVNIMIKNEGDKTTLYDIDMNLSEDQNFNTEVLMKKKKIGFVKDAIYYYRRHGEGVSQTKNNPYYCFEDIMLYNEYLLEKYNDNGVVPKYVQSLVANTIKWRIGSDELLPYHYDKKKFASALNRIKNILKKIDNSIIMNLETQNIFIKFYILRLKGEALELKLKDNQDEYLILDKNKNVIYDDKNIQIQITKLKVKNNKAYLFGNVRSPIFEIEPLQKLVLIIKDNNNKITKKEINTFRSNLSHFHTNMEIANVYGFECFINLDDINEFSFEVKTDNVNMHTNILFEKWAGINKSLHRLTIFKNTNSITYKEKQYGYFKIGKKNILKLFKNFIVTLPNYLKRNKNIVLYRLIGKKKDNIWLYHDSRGVFDNGYIQFKHDLLKKDGVKRYYVVDEPIDKIKNKFTDEELKNVIRFKSFTHKKYYLKSSKIFVSYLSETIYCPFKGITWYADIIDYDLIYLQHGILHADLLRMYAKEFVPIDKFVISSTFERENLKNKYNYNDRDFIISGMPRMEKIDYSGKAQNKILFAPSWRKYLIGELINNKRSLREQEFAESTFYKEIYSFLHSKKLENILKENNLKLEFKLHPIFKDYKDKFKLKNNSLVSLNFDQVDLGDYNIFVTDFSSYQFDYINYKRPIIYFLPDEEQFNAGLHTYRKLDIPYDKAFGDLCLTGEQLLSKIEYYISNNYKLEKKYKDRMDNFFTISSNPCEKIYKEVIKNK